MEFPENECESNVLCLLGLSKARLIPFGILQYIHASCRVGFASQDIATHACRLLCWPAILERLSKKYSKLSQADESELREYYLRNGAGARLLEKLIECLSRERDYVSAADELKKRLGAQELKRRQKEWEDMLASAAKVRSVSDLEWLRIDFDLFDLSTPEAQQYLATKAAAESKAAKKSSPV